MLISKQYADAMSQVDHIDWVQTLERVQAIITRPEFIQVANNPFIDIGRKADLVIACFKKIAPEQESLIRELAKNSRFDHTTEILEYYQRSQQLKAGKIQVTITTAQKPTPKQKSLLNSSHVLSSQVREKRCLSIRSTRKSLADSRFAIMTIRSTNPLLHVLKALATTHKGITMTMKLNTEEISSILQEKIKNLNIEETPKTKGRVISVKDGVVEIYGLEHVMSGELLRIGRKTKAVALNLEHNTVAAILLNNAEKVQEGDTVSGSGEMLTVPVGEAMLGRVVNALGEPVDGAGKIEASGHSPIEKIAPGVITRESVSEPLETGIKAIDTMTPIGRGQRELIIGDRQTGKTTVAIDTIINQKNKGVHCIYVAVGQKRFISCQHYSNAQRS